MPIENICVLTFGTTGGGSVSLRIPRAKATLTDTTVRVAMSQLLSVKALKANSGLIDSSQKAVLQRITATDIAVKP